MATYDALTDPLPRNDPKSQEIAYNNRTDRYRMELPAPGDPAASGVVSLNVDTLPPSGIPVSISRWNGDSAMMWSASGTTDIPVYLTSPIPVSVSVDIETDSIKVYSSSGTPELPVYLTSDLDKNNDSIKSYNVSSSGTPEIPVYLTQPIQIIADIGDEIKILSASGTVNIPTYIQNEVKANVTGRVSADISYGEDSVSIYSASGTAAIETWINNEPLTTVSPDPVDVDKIIKRFTYNVNGDIDTIKEALAATASGSPCKLQTFYYNTAQDVDYIIESIGNW